MSKENVDTVKQLYDAFQATDFQRILGLMAPTIEVVPDASIPDRQSFQGHEGFLDWAARWFEPWEEYRIEPQEFFDCGAQVLVVSRDRGVGGPGGMDLDQNVWTLWTLEDGKATRMQFFLRRETALEAAGLSK